MELENTSTNPILIVAPPTIVWRKGLGRALEGREEKEKKKMGVFFRAGVFVNNQSKLTRKVCTGKKGGGRRIINRSLFEVQLLDEGNSPQKKLCFFFVTMQKELGSSTFVPLKFLSIRIFFLFLHPADKKKPLSILEWGWRWRRRTQEFPLCLDSWREKKAGRRGLFLSHGI